MDDHKRVRLMRDAYTVAILCPLEVELSALRYMLDEEHEPPPTSHESGGDSNEYVFGKLSNHNVVIASLPAGQQGKVSAATVARDMTRSYPSIVLRLLVGIGGGIPSSNADIRLGDVVVSSPTGTEAGVVQYDLGKQQPTGFLRKGILSPPAREWLAVLPKIQSDHRIRPSKVSTFISDMLKRFPIMYKYNRPPPETDVLFESDYLHRMKEPTCWLCDRKRLVDRPARTPDPAEPVIHYGLIASGDRVMEDAIERDRMSNSSGAPICFDMEAAGLMNDFRCVVIRGISNYSDSHKNDIWNPYAAAVAAAFAKELLSYIHALEYIPRKIEETKTVNEDRQEELVAFLKCLGATNPQDDLAAIDNEQGKILNGTCEWVCEEPEYLDWINRHDSSFLKLTGPPGIGKTAITRFLLQQAQNKKIDADPTANRVALYYFCDSGDEKRRDPRNIIRSYLFQLLQKKPQAFARISKSYELESNKNAACRNIYTLWRYFRSVLKAYTSMQVIFFLDALDKTERDSRRAILRLLGDLPQTCDTSQQIRVFVSTRPESDIEYYLSEGWNTLIAGPEKIRTDLGNFIADGVSTLAAKKNYPTQLRNDVLETLSQEADGTFLWASFILEEISRCRNYEVRGKLADLPLGLDEVYDQILRQIEPARVDDAAFVLQWMVVSKRPLTAVELATAYGSHKGIWDSLPSDDEIEELSDVFTACESLLFINREKGTISLVHQSVKDYLCSTRLRGLHDIGRFAVAIDQANRLVFETCWDYFKLPDFNNGQDIIAYEDGGSRLRTQPGICRDNDNDDSSVGQMPAAKIFLSYAASYWKEHAVLSEGSTLSQPRWQNEKVEILPTIRDMWLYRVVKDRPSSSFDLVGYLLKHGANAAAIGEDDEYTALHLAVYAGQYELVELLLSDRRLDPNVRDGIGRTALLVAAVNLHGDIVRLLLDHGARKISTTARVCSHIPNMASQTLDDDQLFLEDGRIDFSLLENLLQTEGRLKTSHATTLIEKATFLLRHEPNVLKISGPVTICSDTYGQYYDLLKIFSIGGSVTVGSYLFLGNYISRGHFSVECLLHLYALKINHPDKVFLLRGGHECEQGADLFTFKLECSHKFGSEKVYQAFINSFRALPLAAVVDEAFLCLHGGPSPELTSLDDIDQLNRHVEPPTRGLMCDILWSRPAKEFFDSPNFEYNETGIGFLSYYYSCAAVQSLLAKTGLTGVISGNEKSQQGHVSRLPWHISLFSAPNYLDTHENKGAILKLGYDGHKIQVTQFDGSPHPYYLPNFMNGLEWSFPFAVEKIADMARFLAGTVEEEADEHNKEANSWLLSEVVDSHQSK